jgi:hypothetical protein
MRNSLATLFSEKGRGNRCKLRRSFGFFRNLLNRRRHRSHVAAASARTERKPSKQSCIICKGLWRSRHARPSSFILVLLIKGIASLTAA